MSHPQQIIKNLQVSSSMSRNMSKRFKTIQKLLKGYHNTIIAAHLFHKLPLQEPSWQW